MHNVTQCIFIRHCKLFNCLSNCVKVIENAYLLTEISLTWLGVIQGSMRLCVDVPQLCSAIQTNLKGSSMDN